MVMKKNRSALWRKTNSTASYSKVLEPRVARSVITLHSSDEQSYDPVVLFSSEHDIATTANHFSKIENLVRDVYSGDVRLVFKELTCYYKSSTTSPVIHTLLQQYHQVAESSDISWNTGIMLLTSFINRAATLDSIDAIQLDSAWRLMHMGTSVKHLAATLLAALNMRIQLFERASFRIEAKRLKYEYEIHLGEPFDAWRGSVSVYNHASIYSSHYAQNEFDEFQERRINDLSRLYNDDHKTVIHGQKSMIQLKEDAEADMAMETLAKLGC